MNSRIALSVLLYIASGPLWSQDAEPDDAEEENALEEVVVTGSRIKRRDFTSPSPITTIDREAFEFSGQPTLEEYLNQMPQLAPDFGRTSNNPGDGTAALNLRGLGPGRTLVLLNGRRVAPSGVGSAIDVNNLPRALVDKVEIITGGASTVYGSDAIAGVINFKTRDDFAGLSVDGSYSISEQGDADVYDANIVYGQDFSNGNGNIILFGGFYERKELFAGERELSSVPYIDTWVNNQVVVGGSPTIPAGRVVSPRVNLGQGPVRVTWNPDGNPLTWDAVNNRYNFAPLNYLQTPLTRSSLGLMGTYDLTGKLELYFEASYMKNEASAQLAEAPFAGGILVNTDNPVLTPQTRQLFETQLSVAPGLARMVFSRRMLELGPRVAEHEREYLRFVAGLRGEITDGWEWDAWLTYTDATETTLLRNDGSRSRLLQGLLVDPVTRQCFNPSGGCVPVDLFGEGRMSQEAVDFVRVDPYQNDTHRKQSLASVVVTGSPLDIWSGPVNMAFGVEWRQDEASFKADDALFEGDTLGYVGDAPVSGTESVYELYTEALLPLIDDRATGNYLGLELGGRYSDYDNAGPVWTWKAGLEWQPMDALRFRTMFQHAVRAPNNEELFKEQYTQPGFAIGDNSPDPCSASQNPVASGVSDKCLAQGLTAAQLGVFEAEPFYPVDYLLGGNPALAPEESDTYTFGLVLTPVAVPDLTLAIDYFDLEVIGTVGDIDAFAICFDEKNTGNVFCGNISRDASGNIAQISQPTSNRGLQAVKGVDTQLQYQVDLPSWLALFDYADFSVRSIWTHYLSAKQQVNVATEIYECAGRFGVPCSDYHTVSFPENRLITTLTYSSDALTANLTWRWIESMDNAATLIPGSSGNPGPAPGIPNVPAYNFFDLGFGYQFNEQWRARFGVTNLLDEEAPNMADNANQNNTDTGLYDLFGRSYFLSVVWNMLD